MQASRRAQSPCSAITPGRTFRTNDAKATAFRGWVKPVAPFQSSGLMTLRGFGGSDVVLIGQDHLTERKTMSDRLVAATGAHRSGALVNDPRRASPSEQLAERSRKSVAH
jgi:hypothetical protein